MTLLHCFLQRSAYRFSPDERTELARLHRQNTTFTCFGRESSLLTIPAQPARIQGTTLQYYRGQNCFEADVEVGSEAHARDVTQLLMESASEIVVDLAVLIEAQVCVCSHDC